MVKLIGSLTLTLILAVSAYAGNMPNEIVRPDPAMTTEITEPSEPTEPEEATEQTPTVTEIMLAVVSVLGLI